MEASLPSNVYTRMVHGHHHKRSVSKARPRHEAQLLIAPLNIPDKNLPSTCSLEKAAWEFYTDVQDMTKEVIVLRCHPANDKNIRLISGCNMKVAEEGDQTQRKINDIEKDLKSLQCYLKDLKKRHGMPLDLEQYWSVICRLQCIRETFREFKIYMQSFHDIPNIEGAGSNPQADECAVKKKKCCLSCLKKKKEDSSPQRSETPQIPIGDACSCTCKQESSQGDESRKQKTPQTPSGDSCCCKCKQESSQGDEPRKQKTPQTPSGDSCCCRCKQESNQGSAGDESRKQRRSVEISEPPLSSFKQNRQGSFNDSSATGDNMSPSGAQRRSKDDSDLNLPEIKICAPMSTNSEHDFEAVQQNASVTEPEPYFEAAQLPTSPRKCCTCKRPKAGTSKSETNIEAAQQQSASSIVEPKSKRNISEVNKASPSISESNSEPAQQQPSPSKSEPKFTCCICRRAKAARSKSESDFEDAQQLLASSILGPKSKPYTRERTKSPPSKPEPNFVAAKQQPPPSKSEPEITCCNCNFEAAQQQPASPKLERRSKRSTSGGTRAAPTKPEPNFEASQQEPSPSSSEPKLTCCLCRRTKAGTSKPERNVEAAQRKLASSILQPKPKLYTREETVVQHQPVVSKLEPKSEPYSWVRTKATPSKPEYNFEAAKLEPKSEPYSWVRTKATPSKPEYNFEAAKQQPSSSSSEPKMCCKFRRKISLSQYEHKWTPKCCALKGKTTATQCDPQPKSECRDRGCQIPSVTNTAKLTEVKKAKDEQPTATLSAKEQAKQKKEREKAQKKENEIKALPEIRILPKGGPRPAEMNCFKCYGKPVPRIEKNLADALKKIVGKRGGTIFLKISSVEERLFHIEVRTVGNKDLGCLYVTAIAMAEAQKSQVFKRYITMGITHSSGSLPTVKNLVDYAFEFCDR